MANIPIKKYKSGSTTLTVWEGVNNKGEKTFSFSLQKSYVDKQKQWQNTNFFYKNDLKDALLVIDRLLLDSVKTAAGQKQASNAPQNVPPVNQNDGFTDQLPDDDVPF